jgi:6-bladed beta-propeller
VGRNGIRAGSWRRGGRRSVPAGGAGLMATVALVAAAPAWTSPASAQQVVDLPASDKALSHALDPVFTIGTFDGADWETFGDIRSVAFDGAGNLYVFDGQSSRVVVVDRNGKYLREMGKKGDGPGELRAPAEFTVMKDGTVVIADLGHRAYVLYGPDGKYERMVSFPGASEGMIAMGDLHAGVGRASVLSSGGGMAFITGTGSGSEPATPTTRPIERIDLSKDPAVSDTLVNAWKPAPDTKPREVSGGGVRFTVSSGGPRTFEPRLYAGPLPDGGVAYADSTTYTVKVADAAGALRRVIRRPFEPQPVTEAMQEAEKKRQLDELASAQGSRMTVVTRSGGGSPQQLDPATVKQMQKGMIDQMRFYPELPVIMNLSTGWSGDIWVVRRGDHPTDVGSVDVLAPAGRYLGTFAPGTLPFAEDLGKHATQIAFGPDGLVGWVTKGELDVPKVVVARLPAVLR